jgi:dienelactone hydrolase
VTTTVHTWLIDGQNIRVVVCEPNASVTIPLVIYVPGLGEPSDAGERWRNAWAAAGYAVVSVQPLAEDASAWESDLARSGDFKTLGRQRYAGAVMSQRVRMLADVTKEAQRRSTAGDSAWRRIDWGKVAIAGFDLGAYTAMAIAGEQVRDADDAQGRLDVRVAIAFSPYANLAAGSLETRYAGIHAPVLSVTSDVDSDPIGLVDGVDLRQAPFEHMEASNKYLLSLRGLHHASLSGTNASIEVRTDRSDNKRAEDRAGTSDSDEGGQRGRSGRRRGPGESMRPDRGRSVSGGGGNMDVALPAQAVQMRMIAAQDISTAFLDAYVKNDPTARDWLAASAPRWLGDNGGLRRK